MQLKSDKSDFFLGYVNMLRVLMDETHHILLNNDRIGCFIVKAQDRVGPLKNSIAWLLYPVSLNYFPANEVTLR